MMEYVVCGIDPEKDLPALEDRLSRLPEWRRRDSLSFLRPIDRLQSAMAFELLAGLLFNCFGIKYDGFRLEYDAAGKPSVSGRKDIYISLAHCRRAVMAVVSDAPVGCDIEEIRRPYGEDERMVADHCYSEGERREIVASSDPAMEFTRIWTIKEALFKLDNTLDIEHLDTTVLSPGHVSTIVSSGCVATIVAQ